MQHLRKVALGAVNQALTSARFPVARAQSAEELLE